MKIEEVKKALDESEIWQNTKENIYVYGGQFLELLQDRIGFGDIVFNRRIYNFWVNLEDITVDERGLVVTSIFGGIAWKL